MTLPPKLFNKYLERFNKLIKAGENIHQAITVIPGTPATPQHQIIGGPRGMPTPEAYRIDSNSFNEWRINCISLLDQVIPQNSPHRDQVARFNQGSADKTRLEMGISILKAIKDDYEKGFLGDLSLQIEAEIAADYMGQAEKLLAEGQSGQYGHVPAAVLSGAVLEKALKTLCKRQNPPIPTAKSDGKPLTLNPLIDELKKVGVFNELKAKELRAWADIRNAAAHGDFDEFHRSDVERMLKGVADFLAMYVT
jgi:hypothetical protein